ncbi:MAG: type II secretion system minor pseudopilin GspH [Arenicellales bacterium]
MPQYPDGGFPLPPAGKGQAEAHGKGGAGCAERDTPGSSAAFRQSGFTLLEIMVVMALIAISVTFVVLNLQRDTDGVAKLEARRFASLIEQARDESILSGRPYAVQVDPNGRTYTFLQHGKEWTEVTNDDIFRQRRFPEDLGISFETLNGPGSNSNDHTGTGDNSSSDAGSARSGLLVIEGLGEITPFILTIRGKSLIYEVSVDDSQNVIVKSEASKT